MEILTRKEAIETLEKNLKMIENIKETYLGELTKWADVIITKIPDSKLELIMKCEMINEFLIKRFKIKNEELNKIFKGG